MAYTTLVNRINSLSTLTSDAYQLNYYLKDGYMDLVHRLSKLDPLKLELFSTTADISDGDGFPVLSGLIIGVQRSTGTKVGQGSIDDYRTANKIPKTMAERVIDQFGFFYRSKFNPAYYVEDSRVFILPEPISGMEDNPETADIDESILEEKGRVSYVPILTQGSVDGTAGSWATLDSSSHKYLRYVPERYTQLIIIYSARRQIDNRMRILGEREEDLEMLQALQVLSAQLEAEYNSLLMVGISQEPPQAPQQQQGRR